MAELPKTYDPKTVEPKWYQRWLDEPRFRGRRQIDEAAVLDCYSAAEHHRRSHARARPEQYHPGYSRAARADAGFGSALAAGDGSRRHRHADGGREMVCAKTKE